MSDKENPLNLPPGSVRAIIAILLTVGIVVQYAITGTAPAFLITAFSTIVVFYFGSKAWKEFKK